MGYSPVQGWLHLGSRVACYSIVRYAGLLAIHIWISRSIQARYPLKKSSVKTLVGISIALPLLLIRNTVGLCFAFNDGTDQRYLPTNFRSKVALAMTVLIVLVCEHCIAWDYVAVGFLISNSKPKNMRSRGWFSKETKAPMTEAA